MAISSTVALIAGTCAAVFLLVVLKTAFQELSSRPSQLVLGAVEQYRSAEASEELAEQPRNRFLPDSGCPEIAQILRWESLALPRTPLPQDDKTLQRCHLDRSAWSRSRVC